MIFDILVDWLTWSDYPVPRLKDHLRDWCIEQDIHYEIRTEKRLMYLSPIDETISLVTWVIEIEDTDDAMLFKLTWQ